MAQRNRTGVGLFVFLSDSFWQLLCLLFVSPFSSLPRKGEGGSHITEVKNTLWDWTRSVAHPCPTVEGMHGEVMSQQATICG